VISDDAVEIKNKRRSERVILRVAVVLSVGLDDGNLASEATCTQVVNAHGGLLRLRMEVVSSQRFILKNLKTGVARQCGVVRTERSGDGKLLIAFQLASPAPDFWPIMFPPKDWQAWNCELFRSGYKNVL